MTGTHPNIKRQENLLDYSNQKITGGVTKTMGETKSIADFSMSESISLKEIDGKTFTIIGVEESNYDDTPGVKITTEESFQLGESLDECNKFHTTRTAIVNKLWGNSKIRSFLEIKEGKLTGNKLGLVKVELVKSKTKGGKDYFDLVEASA